MGLRNTPDPSINWDLVTSTKLSDSIRPKPGFRYCNTCHKLLAINIFNYSKCSRSADGYNYQCKKCQKAYQQSRKSR